MFNKFLKDLRVFSVAGKTISVLRTIQALIGVFAVIFAACRIVLLFLNPNDRVLVEEN